MRSGQRITQTPIVGFYKPLYALVLQFPDPNLSLDSHPISLFPFFLGASPFPSNTLWYFGPTWSQILTVDSDPSFRRQIIAYQVDAICPAYEKRSKIVRTITLVIFFIFSTILSSPSANHSPPPLSSMSQPNQEYHDWTMPIATPTATPALDPTPDILPPIDPQLQAAIMAMVEPIVQTFPSSATGS